MRAAVVLLLLVGLCACMPRSATIHSARPLFNAKDAGGAPVLKPGLWVEPSADCRFDEATSAGAWPACAAWMIVRQRVLITHRASLPPDDLQMDGYVLVSGFPRILQLGAPPRQRAWMYDYKGLRPLAVDGEGAIAAARLWGVDCEIETASAPAGSATPGDQPAASGAGTDPPDPCLTKTREQVRAAIIAAENPKDQTSDFHWVRDEEH